MFFADEMSENDAFFDFSAVAASEAAPADDTATTDQPALVLLTDALDGLDAEVDVEAEVPTENRAVSTHVGIAELQDDVAPEETESVFAIGEVTMDDVDEPADDAAFDTFDFDADLQAIVDLYNNFEAHEQDGTPIVIAPPPFEEGAFFAQVITQGPDGKWYTDASLRTPYEGDEELTIRDPMVDDGVYHTLPYFGCCPVIDWDGEPYLPVPQIIICHFGEATPDVGAAVMLG